MQQLQSNAEGDMSFKAVARLRDFRAPDMQADDRAMPRTTIGHNALGVPPRRTLVGPIVGRSIFVLGQEGSSPVVVVDCFMLASLSY